MEETENSKDFISEAVETYSDMIFKIAYNITCNRDDAFDVCQDVFVRLIRNKKKIKNNEHLKAWLIRAAVNCAKSNRTQAFNRHRVSLDEAVNLPYTDNCDSGIDIISVLMKLPEKYRITIHLFYYEELDIDGIAHILSITKSGVKSRLSRGRTLLRKIIEKESNYE